MLERLSEMQLEPRSSKLTISKMKGRIITIFLFLQRKAWYSIVSSLFTAMKANTWEKSASAQQYEILRREMR